MGYCKEPTYRKLAILAAMDSVVVQGKPGSELLPEYNGRGVKQSSNINRGRGLAVAEGILKPIMTDHVVVCCCYNLAMFIADQRNAVNAPITTNQIRVIWEDIFEDGAMFVMNLTDEQ
jgi:hypothetical protein